MAACRAWVEGSDALIALPYENMRLRRLIRAIPGRRYDGERKLWRIPLDPERAHTLKCLLAAAGQADVQEPLAVALDRLATDRRPECVIDLALPGQDWLLSFPLDHSPRAVRRLLSLPAARSLSELGRGYVPLDEHAARVVGGLRREGLVSLTAQAARALAPAGQAQRQGAREHRPARLTRDRNGAGLVIVGADLAAFALTLARQADLGAQTTRAGALAIPADPEQALRIRWLLQSLDCPADRELSAWLAHHTVWRGRVNVGLHAEQAVLLLEGQAHLLPSALVEQGQMLEHALALPLTVEMLTTAGQTIKTGASTRPAARCIRALRAGQAPPPAILTIGIHESEEVLALATGFDAGLTVAFADMPGTLDAHLPGEGDRAPAVRIDPFCVPHLDAFIAEHEPHVDDMALAALEKMRRQHAQAAKTVAASHATDAQIVQPDGLTGQLKAFQRAGVSYLLTARHTFLADEQGLGKTIQALAAIEMDNAYPAIVVSPASLKLNWVREAERWLPGRTLQVLSGTTGHLHQSDITILNYDILPGRQQALQQFGARALILDESHYCKNPRAKRTRAAVELAESLPDDALTVALTGTPVMNRPDELASQLKIIGRLSLFGSAAQLKRRFQGSDAYLRLHWHLRSRCFVRRLKSEVLTQLPAKSRQIVPVPLDNETEYRLAERDLLAWLATLPLDLETMDAKQAAALRAEQLVRIGALKLLAARGKLHAALAWIEDFLTSGESLVLFAHHREICEQVLNRFPDALHILGTDTQKARDQAVRTFQDPDGPARLIVCSIHAAGQGLTLTRASNVAFLELDWTPARHDQAEDRCHRIGQRDAVNAVYLLAADTIDEEIAGLLDRKRSVVDAVTDGRDEDEQSVLDSLVHRLRRGAGPQHDQTMTPVGEMGDDTVGVGQNAS